MATLYLDRHGLTLRAEGEALAIHDQTGRLRALPLALLERVIVQAEALISTRLLARMAGQGTGLAIVNRRNNRLMGSVSILGGADAARRIAQYRNYLQLDWRLVWAARLISAKLRVQGRVLRRVAVERPDAAHVMKAAAETVEQQARRLRQDRPENLAALMGIEGAAAALYFAALARGFAPGLGFQGRNRRPPQDPVNATLSLVYTLLHHQAVTVACCHGLDPHIGFLHEVAHGRESLACDLIEPLRPRADEWVWDLFRKRMLRAEHFTTLGERCLLGKAGRRIFYEQHELRHDEFSRYLRRLCRMLLRKLAAKGDNQADYEDTLSDGEQEDAD